MSSDAELLKAYVSENSDAAFAKVVERYIDMVYSSALRQSSGDRPLAEDITQRVFADLAHKAAGLEVRENIAGWLYQHTRWLVMNAVRAEIRRRKREQQVEIMNPRSENPPDERWSELEPVLDEALSELPKPDQEALLLRYFMKRNHQEIGEQQGSSAEAARKRVDRALEKLRAAFKRRGTAVTMSGLALVLSEHAVVAAPAKLLVSAAAVTALPSTGTILSAIPIMTAKTKIICCVAVAAGVATPVVLQQIAIQKLERQNLELRAQSAQLDELGKLRDENARLAKWSVDPDELLRLREDHSDLMRLRGELGVLREQNSKLNEDLSKLQARQKQSEAVAQPTPSEVHNEEAIAEWIPAAARLRKRMISGQGVTEEELKWLIEAKPLIEQMERDPKGFSDFQTELIKETVATLDADRLQRIKKIIKETYEQAVASGLDLPSKPAANYEDWVARRHALDRAATDSVQDLLSAEEREAFNRRFIGVMGVDLGTGVEGSNYPEGFLGW